LESARKLRWYDKADTAAIVRTHLREKRELQDTIAGLKKLLLRSGVSEREMDVEVAALVSHADAIQESDEGVSSVLLAGLQAEMEVVQASIQQLEQELETTRAQLRQYESVGAGLYSIDSSTPTTAGAEEAAGAAAGGRGGAAAAAAAAGGGPLVDPQLVDSLARSVEAFEEAMAAASATTRRIRATEGELHAQEAAAAVAAYAAQQHHRASHSGVGGTAAGGGADGWDGDGSGSEEEDDDGDSQQPAPDSALQGPAAAALVAKLQRLEAERRMAADENAELAAQLDMARAAVSRVATLTDAVAQAEEQRASLRAALEGARAEISSLRDKLRAAEEAAEKRGAEVRRLQAGAQGAADLGRMRDMCAEAEERAAVAERRLAVADARVQKAEAAARDAQAAAKEGARALAALEVERDGLKAKLEEAHAALESGAGSGSGGSGGPPAEAVARLAEQLHKAEEDLRSAQRDAATSSAALRAAEARAGGAEAREARLMAEMRELEGVAAEREELAAQVSALRGKLAETRAERGQLETYKQVAHELEAGRSRVEEELLVTGQLVTQLEARLRDALARADAAEMASQMGEARVRAAEAGVAREVELRMAAAASNRALWPAAIKDEYARLEGRTEALVTSLATAHSRLAEEGATVAALLAQKADMGARIRDLEDRVELLEVTSGDRIRELEDSLEVARGEALNARAAAVEAEREARKAQAALELRRTFSHATESSLPAASQGGAASQAAAAAASAANKWQVQNKVGGGSLYGVADEAQTAAIVDSFGGASHGHGHSHSHSHGDSSAAEASTSANHHNLPKAPSGSHLHQQLTSRASSGSLSAMGAAASTSAGQHQQQQPGGGAPAASGGSKHLLEGVDVVYLKNVVLKFMEAAMAGRVAERDALLPAVATLLQATPAEYKVLRKVCVNTAPPTVQVLSAFGIRL